MRYSDITNEIAGYLTPTETKQLLRLGMRFPLVYEVGEDETTAPGSAVKYVADLHLRLRRQIVRGDSRPSWQYFAVGPHNPEFVRLLCVNRKHDCKSDD